MGAPIRPARARSSGGRTLMLLGVLLALAAGTIVIFVVSNVVPPTGSSVNVIVAATDLPTGTILSVTAGDAHHTLITAAFKQQQMPQDAVPKNALAFTSQDALNILLNNKIIVGTFYQGEVLRQNDPRLVDIGQATPGSLTLLHPDQLPPGSILIQFPLPDSGGGAPALVSGDHIDLLVTECGLVGAKSQGGCETQTTLENIYVYAVTGNSAWLVLTHQDALNLKFLKETGKTDIVIRKPGDKDPAKTISVDASTIVSQFHFDK
jgi:Flp pilus assembly protein CpaB